jgi:hypothetical protein
MIVSLPLAYLEALIRDARVVELRARLPAGMWISGLFDNAADLLRQMQALSAAGANVYSTLNRPAPAVARRVKNTMHQAALKDGDMLHRVRIPFDFDPVRPTGVASTANELAYAIKARDVVATALRSLGWPDPAKGLSGNGGHLLYRCCIPVTAESSEQLGLIYAGLFAEHTGGKVIFDRSVRNPGRIWRAYGSVNRKGPPSADRPHRTASIAIPREWRALDPRQIDRLANSYARHNERSALPHPKPSAPMPCRQDGSRGDLATLDVHAWFSAHGAYGRELGRGKHAVLCPWIDEHSTGTAFDSSTVVWEACERKWPSFKCLHAHCADRTIRDLLALWRDADAFCSGSWTPAKKRGRK